MTHGGGARGARATLRIARAGAGASLQDRGRRGYRRYGVPVSGPVDWVAHALALRLARADPDGPAIEFGPGGLTVEAHGAPVALGVAGGGASARWRHASGTAVLAAPFAIGLAPGERLLVRPGPGGWGTLAARGLDAGPAVLGSHATAVRAGLGPSLPEDGGEYDCEGASAAWPTLHLDPLDDADDDGADDDGRNDGADDARALRVLPGPQAHLFGDALSALATEPYTVTHARDRMGVRLDGPALLAPEGHDIVSDGLVEGAVQVPGDGRPIVLMADRAPTGGYPKIAVLARADLPRLARAAPGTMLRFEWTTADAARAATARLTAAVADPRPRRRAPLGEGWLRSAMRGR